jgi:hypothetical protein
MKMRIKFLLAGCFLFFLLALPGFRLPAAGSEAVKKTAPLVLRYPDPARLQRLQADEALRYRQERRPGLSGWDRLWWQVKQALGKLLYSPGNATYVSYFLYALGTVIVGWALFKLLQIDPGSLFGRQPASGVMPYETYQENIHGVDFPALIAEAEEQGDYRRAIRLYYLSILKGLTDKALIEWKPGKTNRSYVYEIKNGTLRSPFENLTRQFEYIWYGASTLNEPLFRQMRLSFEDFLYLVKTKG